MTSVQIGPHRVGEGSPCFIIAEIGINHNGDLDLARRLIDVAYAAGCDAVKFQKRTPDLCVPFDQRRKLRQTPWGEMTYLEYKKRLEFGHQEYRAIDKHCRERGILWFASAWDAESLRFVEEFDPPCHKVCSAVLTDRELMARFVATGKPLIVSTGMSSLDEIRQAVDLVPRERLVLLQCTSTYPAQPEELNLRVINSLAREFGVPVGYSGHEMGLQTTYAAVALGARVVERHVTLDRTMWGSDQAASVESTGLFRMVRDIRVIERALGDGVKVVYESELPSRSRLRKAS